MAAGGLPLLCMEEGEVSVWAYGGCGIPGSLRLFSVDQLLRSESRSIDLYEWKRDLLKWPRDGSVLIPALECPLGMPCYAAISHTWQPTEEVCKRREKANRPLFVKTGEEQGKRHEISWFGLVQAATAAEHLDCEYLWLDLLCLDQLSTEDKKLQVAHMHKVFANATAVIVMPGGVSAAQGVDQESTWINRAWTLQEATLCYQTWALVDWRYGGPSFRTSKNGTVFTKLHGDVAIVPVDGLLRFKPGELLGSGYMDDDPAEGEAIEIDIPVYCLGRDAASTFALASALPARRIDGEFDKARRRRRIKSARDGGHEGEDEPETHREVEQASDCDDGGWEDIDETTDEGTSDGSGEEDASEEDGNTSEGARPDEEGSSASENDSDEDAIYPDDDASSYKSDNDEDNTVVRHCAAWRSMWLRTSTRPQDMVFSSMHLIGATLDVDYNQPLRDLVFDLVAKTSSIPGWLTIGYDTPVMPNSGLIPEIPQFTAQSEPTYTMDGKVVPAATTVCRDYRCYRFDLEIKSTDVVYGHLICARMLDVKAATAPETWVKDHAFDYQSDIRLSSGDYELSTTCRFKGRMGSVVVIVGRRLADHDGGGTGWFMADDRDPLVYLLGKNERGVWQKTGGGTLIEELFGRCDDLNSIQWRHLQVGGKPGAEPVPCDCGKEKPRKVRSVKPWEFKDQNAMDRALRKACYDSNEKKVRQLLQMGANVNAEPGKYFNALCSACANGSDRIVEILIENGADIHAKGGTFGNALQAAASRSNHRVVRLLLEKGANVNAQGGFHGNALQAAVRSGLDNDAAARLLIDAGADVNAEGGEDGDALTAAATTGNLLLVHALLKFGADVRGHGGKHGSPLMAAADCGESTSQEIVRILIQNGADPDDGCRSDAEDGKYIVNALQSACRSFDTEIIRFLIENGAEVNARCGSYGTALGVAAFYSAFTACKMLLAYGADVNAQGGDFGTALQAAVACNDPQDITTTLLLIQNGADVNTRGGAYGSALQAALHLKRGNRARLLIQHGASVDVDKAYAETLAKILLEGYEGMVQQLIESGSDVNARGGRYGTALQAASCNDSVRLVKLLGGKVKKSKPIQGVSPEAHRKVVQLLVEKGATVNARGGYYGNALQAASHDGNVEVVRYLVMNEAHVNAKGGRYGYALQAAARCGHQVIVQGLIQAGANVNAQGGRYGTALQAACRYGEKLTVECLINAGADVNIGVDPSGNSAVGLCGNALLAAAFNGTEMSELLLSKGASVGGVDDQGRNALHIAAGKGDCKLIDLLLPLVYVGDIKSKVDRLGRTYFHHAAASGSVEAVELFLALGVQRDAIDIDGWNALHWAARKGTKLVVRRLIEAGMDRATRTRVGNITALRVAIFHKHLSLARLLEVPSTSSLPAAGLKRAPTGLGTSIQQAVIEDPDPDAQIVGFQHHGAQCAGCQFGIFGPIFSCRKCKDFDYCFRCVGPLCRSHIQKNPGHSFTGLGDAD